MSRFPVILATLLLASSVHADEGAEASGRLQEIVTTTIEGYAPADVAPQLARLELRSQASVVGDEVTLRSVVRWGEHDEPFFAPIADLVVMRLDETTSPGYGELTLENLKRLLHDAGVNLGTVNIAGARLCQVNRADVAFDERSALLEWYAQATPAQPAIDDRTQAALLSGVVVQMEARTYAEADPSAPVEPGAPVEVRSLERLLIEDVAQRLQWPIESLVVEFRAEDRKALSLAEPMFAFAIEPQRAGDLGEVSWIVTIGAGPESRRVSIVGFARGWQEQLFTTRPLAAGQTITADDFEQRRVLIERRPADAPVTRDAALGQTAARDLRVGTMLGARSIKPVELIRTNQLVTVKLRVGQVEIVTAAKALENGVYGQAIKLRNESNRQTLDAIVTGPGTAEVVGTQ